MWLELKVINMRLRSFRVVDGGTRILEFELPSAKHAGKSQSDKYLYLKDIKETQNYFSLYCTAFMRLLEIHCQCFHVTLCYHSHSLWNKNFSRGTRRVWDPYIIHFAVFFFHWLVQINVLTWKLRITSDKMKKTIGQDTSVQFILKSYIFCLIYFNITLLFIV